MSTSTVSSGQLNQELDSACEALVTDANAARRCMRPSRIHHLSPSYAFCSSAVLAQNSLRPSIGDNPWRRSNLPHPYLRRAGWKYASRQCCSCRGFSAGRPAVGYERVAVMRMRGSRLARLCRHVIAGRSMASVCHHPPPHRALIGRPSGRGPSQLYHPSLRDVKVRFGR